MKQRSHIVAIGAIALLLSSLLFGGPRTLAAFDAFSPIQAEAYTSMSGVGVYGGGDGSSDVGHIDNGEWIAFADVNFGSGATSVSYRVASPAGGGTIEARLGSTSGTLLGSCAIAATGSWQSYTTKSCTVGGASGSQHLYLVFGGTAQAFQLNWLQFSGGSGSGPTATRTYTTGSGPTATRTHTPTNTLTPGGVCWNAWVSTTIYNSGDQVSYNGTNYQANYWTQGNAPAASSGPPESGQPWTARGACGGSGPVSTATATRTHTSASGTNPTATSTHTPTPGGSGPSKIIAGYFPYWEWGSELGWNTTAANAASALDGTKYSHLLFAFIDVQGTGTNARCQEYASSDTATIINALKQNKSENPGLKILMSVGGASTPTNNIEARVEAAASTPEGRAALVNSCVAMMNSYGIDGIDIDWEFPTSDTETANHAALVTAFDNALGAGKLLTAATPPTSWFGRWLDWSTLNQKLDYYMIMAYDYYGNWDPNKTYFNSPMYCNDPSGAAICAVSTVDYYAGKGVARGKMVLGAAMYGNRWTASATPAFWADTAGMSYAQIPYRTLRMNGYLSGTTTAGSGYTRTWDSTRKNPYLIGNNQFIGYDDITSIAERATWIKSNSGGSLAGIMFWDIHQDYNNELLNAAWDVLK